LWVVFHVVKLKSFSKPRFRTRGQRFNSLGKWKRLPRNFLKIVRMQATIRATLRYNIERQDRCPCRDWFELA